MTPISANCWLLGRNGYTHTKKPSQIPPPPNTPQIAKFLVQPLTFSWLGTKWVLPIPQIVWVDIKKVVTIPPNDWVKWVTLIPNTQPNFGYFSFGYQSCAEP